MDDTVPNPEAAPINVGDRLELKIDDLAFGGEGVGRVDGFVVFVPFVNSRERKPSPEQNLSTCLRHRPTV